jgi:zinc transporter, ZIP family
MGSRKDLPPMAGGEAGAVADDVLAATDDFRHHEAGKRALTTGLFIAAAIGLHNFAEGLAIGVSAGSDEIALATVLVIGFALHNATEGFGIIGPLGNVRPSWGWLGLAGLIAGLPVVIGASIGYSVESEPLEIAFYGLAGGAILYVIGEIWQGVRRYGHKELGLLLLAAGFSAGVLTDFVIAYAGG